MSLQPLLEVPAAVPPPRGDPCPADRLRRERIANALATVTWVLLPWALGAALALLLPTSGTLPPSVDRLSHVLGWVYFSAWSVSFYPQLWLNFRRQSVVGLSLDFQMLNMLGFACYAVYNSALYYNPAVREQYAALHEGQLPAVHANDVFFAVHAAAATSLTLLQCCIYDRGGRRPNRISVAAIVLLTGAAAAWAAAVLLWPSVRPNACPETCPLLSWLSWLYFLGGVKTAVSVTKYIPQVVLNCRRRSTEGFNVWNVLLDFEGGTLSIAQQALDASSCADWSFLTGNPVKFALGSISIFYDVVIMVQHYVVYPHSARAAAEALMQRDLEKAARDAALEAGAGGGALEAGAGGGAAAPTDADAEAADAPAEQQPLLRRARHAGEGL